MKPLAFYVDSPFYFEQFEKADFILREFPDGESYLKINADVKNREIFIFNSLNNPNQKILPLLFLVKYLKEQGTKHITLASPYLPYMRQDKIFNPGEVLSSKYFAELLSDHIDKLITVDPHLHRYKNLSEIYRCENKVLHATNEIADYIKHNIKNPIIIGPDAESEQWAKEIADDVGAPYVIAQKKRMNDYEVDMLIPGIEKFKKNTPVLIDDIISTAQTMIKAVSALRILGFAPPVCIGVHAVFAGDAYENLVAAGPEKIITCNTIKHSSNQIDLSDLLASAF
ncbi:MAG TPA: ribose-phosphate diphosphokinase [Gammaproteobacteria bacterium]|nr:ribose-phosphate diphosphokinase [Gammaproteobacteria bacterium]